MAAFHYNIIIANYLQMQLGSFIDINLPLHFVLLIQVCFVVLQQPFVFLQSLLHLHLSFPANATEVISTIPIRAENIFFMIDYY